MLLRSVHHGLAAAHAMLGQDDQAAEAERKSGLGAAPAGSRLMFGGFWATAQDGFRFTSPRIFRPEPGIQVAQGYDFSDLAFITTSDGVVAIDAGTAEDRVKAALGALDPPADGAISLLILTHAHWDHVGGAGALRGPGTQVIAQAGLPAGLNRAQGERPRFRYFAGAAGDIPPSVVPDQLISQPTSLTIGGTELVLYPEVTRAQRIRRWLSSDHDLIRSSSSPAGVSPVRVVAREPGSRLAVWSGNGPGRSPASKATLVGATERSVASSEACRVVRGQDSAEPR